MLPENRQKLEKYRFVLQNRSFTPAPGYDLREVYDVIVAEFSPGYIVDWHCNYCLMKMVEYAFEQMDMVTTINVNLEK